MIASPVHSVKPTTTRGHLGWLTTHCVIVLTALGSLTFGVAWLKRLATPQHTDFVVFYAAGRLTAAGKEAAAYSLAAIHPIERGISHRAVLSHLPFLNPPHFAWFLGLLAHTSLHRAFMVWTILNLSAFVLAALLTIRHLQPSARLLATVGFLGCLPLVIGTLQGENSGLIVLGLVLVLLGFGDHRIGASDRSHLLQVLGMAGGVFILSMKPQFLVVPAILILVRWRGRELTAISLGLSAALVLGLLSGGFDAYSGFVRMMMDAAGWTTQHDWGSRFNFSLMSQMHALFGYGRLPTGLGLALSGVLIIVLVRTMGRGSIAWLPVTVVTLLVANHLLFHDLALVYPGSMVALAAGMRRLAVPALLAPWVDPVVYPFTHIHLFVLVGVIIVALWALDKAREPATGTMGWSKTRSGESPVWRLLGLRPWGSASESGTRSMSSGS